MHYTRLRSVRRARRMTQKTASELIGCDQSSLSHWERSEAIPQRRHAVRLELAFGETIDALLQPEPGAGSAPAKGHSRRAVVNRPAPVKEVN